MNPVDTDLAGSQPKLLYPPYGALTEKMLKVLARIG